MSCYFKVLKNTKSFEGSNKFKQYLIPCAMFSKHFHEMLGINSRTENKGFRILILRRICLNGGTKCDFFYLLLDYPTANMGLLSRAQPHQLNVNHCIFYSLVQPRVTGNLVTRLVLKVRLSTQ